MGHNLQALAAGSRHKEINTMQRPHQIHARHDQSCSGNLGKRKRRFGRVCDGGYATSFIVFGCQSDCDSADCFASNPRAKD